VAVHPEGLAQGTTLHRAAAFLTLHGPLTLSVKPKSAVGWFWALLEMLGRCMEDPQPVSRAVRRGDPAYIEHTTERG